MWDKTPSSNDQTSRWCCQLETRTKRMFADKRTDIKLGGCWTHKRENVCFPLESGLPPFSSIRFRLHMSPTPGKMAGAIVSEAAYVTLWTPDLWGALWNYSRYVCLFAPEDEVRLKQSDRPVSCVMVTFHAFNFLKSDDRRFNFFNTSRKVKLKTAVSLIWRILIYLIIGFFHSLQLIYIYHFDIA